jgi:hypothetical protein
METRIKVLLGVLLLFCIVMSCVFLSTKSSKNKAVADANKAMALVIKADSIAKAEYARRISLANDNEAAINARSEAIAELDTIRPVAEKADSLIKVAKMTADSVSRANVELQKKLAEAISKAGKVSKFQQPNAQTKNPSVTKGPGPKVTTAKLKGHPVISDKDSTFTYVASDSLLIAKFAPAGFKLIKKPR